MERDKSRKAYFTRQLIHWHKTENNRSLPWKEEKDPYRIWLSEIILQQTRAEQGLPYYMSFTTTYPTLTDLANAEDEAVFRIWQGLGYYNRCKNMLATARHIVKELDATFPGTYDQLLSLKGIGPYTAAAIASFAFAQPHAVVDGNVYRVLSRYFGIDTPYDTTEGKKQFYVLAEELLDKNDSAAYNQAIMDLGATICTPKNTRCDICPLQKNCIATNNGIVHLLPIKSKKLVVKKRFFHYVLLQSGDAIWVAKRTGKDIWENLHELLLIEQNEPSEKKVLAQTIAQEYGLNGADMEYEGKLTQRLTHQLIEFYFYSLQVKKQVQPIGKEGKWIVKSDIKKIGFPKSIVSFLEKKLYF